MSATGAFAYQAVYRYLGELIDAAGPGQRLPPLRLLARQLSVSMSTVQSAYSLLETQGRVYSVRKSGYFTCPRSQTGSDPGGEDLLERLNALAQQEQLQQMSHASAVLEQPLEILLHRWERHLLRLSPRLAGSLAHPCGDTQLRRALAARYSTAVDQCWNADNLYLGVDAASVLRLLILALALKGQTVVVVTPCPWPLLRALRDAGVQVLELALCDRGRIDLQWLEPQLKGGRVRLMLLDSRVNLPHGTLMPLAQRRALGRLLVHYGTWLLEHDGGGELCFSETPRLRELIDPQRLLILGSLEQGIGAEGGYGYLMSRHFAPSLRQVFLQRACRLPPIRQQAIARLFDGGQVDAHLQRLRCLWQVRLGTWQQQLDRHLAEHVEYTRPKGGTGLWLRCRQPVNGRRLFERLVQRRIVVTPGELFSLRGDFSQCLLLACPDLSEAQHEALWPVVAEVLAREGRES